MKYSKRGNVDPFIVMDVMENARKAEDGGRKIIHMEVGQPSTAAPSDALERTSQIIKSNPLGYTVALGLPELRKKISDLYGRWYNLDLDPSRVIVTSCTCDSANPAPVILRNLAFSCNLTIDSLPVYPIAARNPPSS